MVTTISGPRVLLRQLRETMAEPLASQERLDKIVALIADNMHADVCSFYVLRDDGAVIPGLYAAGSAGQGGLLLEGHGHHLGWAFISGRIAGRHAALEATR